jgi:hypothetical protein|eukprot:evm.model.NODE_1173_length_22579_cov_19.576509.10
MAYSVEKGGLITPNIIFGILTVLFLILFQKEHASRCYVLPLQKLAARLFILAPTYSFFLLLTGYVTRGKPFWDICMAGLDGYALFCFFGLMVLGAGGEEQVMHRLALDLPQMEGDSTAVNGAGANGASGGKLQFSVCLCLPMRFNSARSVYTFLKASVIQVMVSRPVFLAASSICKRLAPGQLANLGERGFRLLSLLALIYAVMSIGRTYHLIYQQIWPAFNPVAAFMVVKGFILLVAVQDFVIAMIFSARDPFYEEQSTRSALRAYSLIVSIQALLYLSIARFYLQPNIFQSYSPQSSLAMTLSFCNFMEDTYSFWIVFGGDMPPRIDEKRSARTSSTLLLRRDPSDGLEMSGGNQIE